MNKEDLDKEAAHFWQDDLAKFFPKSKGPTSTELRMFEGGYRLAQEEIERLREALENIANLSPYSDDVNSANVIARAALEGR